jgi:hypothetical protein
LCRPAYPDRESSLLKRLAATTGTAVDETDGGGEEEARYGAASATGGHELSITTNPEPNGLGDLMGDLGIDDSGWCHC